MLAPFFAAPLQAAQDTQRGGGDAVAWGRARGGRRADLTYHSARVVDLGCVTFRAAAASLSGDDWRVVRFLCTGRGGVWTDDGKSGLDSPEALEHLRRGGGMPLVGYVADECHRFATADEVHGEQSFLDTCRSFGTFCVLACQSVSSLEPAFASGGGDAANGPALSVLLNNAGTKLLFPLHRRCHPRALGQAVPGAVVGTQGDRGPSAFDAAAGGVLRRDH